MKFIRKKISFVSLFMVTIMLSIIIPWQSVVAAMIPTEVTISADKAREARDQIKNIISKENIRKALISHGIDPNEAQVRVDSLSDSEAIAVADRIEELSAGGDAIGVIVGAALIIFLVLLITDILGLTDVFPFVRGKR